MMVLPSKEQRRGAGQPPGRLQARPLRCSWRVLAERNQSVVPVGVWVESAPGQQSPAFASASRVEEELKEQQRKKAASLRRFQAEVRQRVNRQVRLRRRQELQKAYETNPAPCLAAAVPVEESEELLLAGHHDLPAELLERGAAANGAGQDDDFYIKIEFRKVCDGSVEDSSLPGPPGRPHSEYQPPPKLWAGVDQEETRKQRIQLGVIHSSSGGATGLQGVQGSTSVQVDPNSSGLKLELALFPSAE
ncbi:hypothetical protein DUI87_31604 [Hirundo rustica rustica]|uniref:Uncharacterized protein n=1 Tax=Hirundo rustica rustica TaxID=333673 RepID=A0A3M0ITU9_HIRRU|nr:hypothetical protein DUI87_31604 [Hirundo rustica rustica]